MIHALNQIWKRSALVIILAGCVSNILGRTLHVGTVFTYPTLSAAAAEAIPGDTILVHEGVYNGGVFVNALQGTSTDWIHIRVAPAETVLFEGGSNAWQFSDAAYLHIEGFIFQRQTGNGVNFDDGGSYDSPAHHIVFANCTFQDIAAGGNNDLLKLSGLDSFEIRNCVFVNGSPGGSGIDMVGCHDGLIIHCYFEDMGSNSIQAKGGTRNIRIEANLFKNGGARAVNLGGSTGLAFFRPIDAPYEAADLKVYSNIFLGAESPVAFVGCINSEVINNTIYLPGKWVLRILQETIDPDRFPPCGFNTFRNNIVYLDNQVTVEVNIGPNTAPETFTFSNNIWHLAGSANWDGPELPVPDPNSIIADPLFEDAPGEYFALNNTSPAIAAGYDVDEPTLDHEDGLFLHPRSIGAYEGGVLTSLKDDIEWEKEDVILFPNPAREEIHLQIKNEMTADLTINLYDLQGNLIATFHHEPGPSHKLPLPSLASGIYWLRISKGMDYMVWKKCVLSQ